MSTTLAIIAAWIIIILPLGIAAGFYLRARREQIEEPSEFATNWDERPLDEIVTDLRAITKAHNVNFDGFNPQTREWEPLP